MQNKGPGDSDSDEVLAIKSLIRWSEAKAGAIVAGCREEDLHFLDLPFYRTGTIAKNPLSEEDAQIVRELIERVQPAQIYVAGDLSDPHGTHRVCAEAIFRALAIIERDGGARPEVLLYRGAWQEWAPHEIDIAVPLSPHDLQIKRRRHLPPRVAKRLGPVPRPRRSPRVLATGRRPQPQHGAVYNQFGLPEYFALEGFVRWNGQAL